MASNKDPGREPHRRRRTDTGDLGVGLGSHDLNDQASTMIGAIPRSQPNPPPSQPPEDPRYQDYPPPPIPNTYRQPSRPITDNYHSNYTLRDYEQSQHGDRGHPIHGGISHPGHFTTPVTAYGPGGRGPQLDYQHTAQGSDYAMRPYSDTANIPISLGYTGQPLEYIPSTTTGSNQPFSHQIVPSPSPSGASTNQIFDSRYRVQSNPRGFFKVGRVFAVLWHENTEATATPRGGTRSRASECEITVGRFGQRIYSDIRRMVVFKEQDRCSWCFPVHTYSRQGVAKRGVDPSKHAIIYMDGTQPRYGPNEPGMTKEPLKVTPVSYDQKLDRMSRLNFGKTYTVEHNVRVLPIGHISEESIARFQNYARRETELGY
ncbi:hypothetical protein BDV23DRAFT_155811 [Aspergillus alliaceus]|uniref:DUF6590 domain-containing protein n=1 Tax=Petromyces alliaceus TaxID=209559 RepID=A0A5N7C8Y7_PETAA|nr:hypothetical protein BDV23DRAFT_155811 [Aspergillus alliaceus]